MHCVDFFFFLWLLYIFGSDIHSSDDGTSDEEYMNDKVQELLTEEEMEVIYKFFSAEAEAYKLKFV